VQCRGLLSNPTLDRGEAVMFSFLGWRGECLALNFAG